jgi:Fe2+ or Zn2+ uptake regulation protein
MINQYPHSFSKSRTKKQQEAHNRLSDQILNYINHITAEWEAENLWLIMKTDGNTLSQATFNSRLKKLVEAGLVEKRVIKYNKYLYQAVCR